jgi:ubiquitin carboxyl-terminal hydrolase 25/28
MYQAERSVLAGINERPDQSTRYFLATYCQECLHHFDISVDFGLMPEGGTACDVESEKQLHHFQTCSRQASATQKGHDYQSVLQRNHFQCSAPACAARVEICIKSPRLDVGRLKPIITSERVYQRGQRAIAEEPERYATQEPLTSLEVLGMLRTYIKDALTKVPGDVKRIAFRNKKFLLGFANDCDELLQYLGFTHIQETTEDGDMDFWLLPSNEDEQRRQFLDDVCTELMHHMKNRPERERQASKIAALHVVPLPVKPHIERSFGCYDYPRNSRYIDLVECKSKLSTIQLHQKSSSLFQVAP